MRLALLALFCLTVSGQNLTLDKQAAIGRQIAGEVRGHTTPVESPDVRNYVTQLASRITRLLPTATFIFSVVSTEDDNALHEPLVLPGGYIFVPVNLLLAANDEGELAGMLAQAIARGPLLVATSAAIVITTVGSFGGDKYLPSAAMDQWKTLELHADQIAALTMSRAGVDPGALLRYIERVQPRDEAHSPFPPRAVRITALREAIRDIPPVVQEESAEFQRIQKLVRPAPPALRAPPSLLAN